jgi:hypothetical protein
MTTEKKPTLRRWRQYQTERPSLATVRKWFQTDRDGVAVVLGDVSGSLVCRDFDQMDVYDGWAARHLKLANTLPTVQTARGRHVYCRCSDQRSIIDLGDGEFRGAGIAVLPPSLHASGDVYTWAIPLPDGPVPELDPVVAGLLPAHVTDEDQRRRKRTDEERGDGGGVACSDADLIEQAIQATLPEREGRRHRCVFELARRLKGIPSLADADPADLEDLVRRWHALALPRIRTQEFVETLIDFINGWEKVECPTRANLMSDLLERARGAPPAPCAERYDSEKMQLLVRLCRELQREAGRRPFFLACSTVSDLLGVSKMTASRWLFLLRRHKVVTTVEKGGTPEAPRMATRYRFTGEM